MTDFWKSCLLNCQPARSSKLLRGTWCWMYDETASWCRWAWLFPFFFPIIWNMAVLLLFICTDITWIGVKILKCNLNCSEFQSVYTEISVLCAWWWSEFATVPMAMLSGRMRRPFTVSLVSLLLGETSHLQTKAWIPLLCLNPFRTSYSVGLSVLQQILLKFCIRDHRQHYLLDGSKPQANILCVLW